MMAYSKFTSKLAFVLIVTTVFSVIAGITGYPVFNGVGFILIMGAVLLTEIYNNLDDLFE